MRPAALTRYAACALCALLAAALIVSGQRPLGADGDICFVAIDDTLPYPLSPSTMPFWEGGALYVDSEVFEDPSLGIYINYDKSEWILSLYNSNHQLDFYLTMMSSYDSYGNFYSNKALTKGSYVFVPVSFVCAFFGLGYSYITDYTDYPIVRITTGSQVYSNSTFASQASSIISSRVSSYLGTEPVDPDPTQTPPPASPSPTAAPTPTVPPSPPAPTAPEGHRRVSLVFSVGEYPDPVPLASALTDLGLSAVFEFDSSSFPGNSAAAARIWSLGHCAALSAGDLPTCDAFNSANDLLDGRFNIRIRLCITDEEEDANAARERGYIPFAWDREIDEELYARPIIIESDKDPGEVCVIKIDLEAFPQEDVLSFVTDLISGGFEILPLNESSAGLYSAPREPRN